MIRADRVGYRYDRRPVVDGVTLETVPGRVLGVIGPNGSGKTTLLRMLHGAIAPTSGTVSLAAETAGRSGAARDRPGPGAAAPLGRWSPRQIANEIAVVVQESDTATTATVAESVLLGRTPRLSSFARLGDGDHAAAFAALERVGCAHLATRSFAALSGGERQRVLIARALAQQAGHLLMDEPTNHLDIRYQHEILALVRALGVTTVVVLHDLNLAAAYCHELVMLEDGRVAAAGTPGAVLQPELVERVYGIGTRRWDLDGRIHLAFAPLFGEGASAMADPAVPHETQPKRGRNHPRIA